MCAIGFFFFIFSPYFVWHHLHFDLFTVFQTIIVNKTNKMVSSVHIMNHGIFNQDDQPNLRKKSLISLVTLQIKQPNPTCIILTFLNSFNFANISQNIKSTLFVSIFLDLSSTEHRFSKQLSNWPKVRINNLLYSMRCH